MANSNEGDPEYKAVLVKNDTSGSTVFLSVYSAFDPICWLPFKKESIEPGKQYFYRDKDAFKYDIRTQKKETKKAKKNIVLTVKKWEEDTLISVKDGTSDEGLVHEESLSKYPDEREIEVSDCESRCLEEVVKNAVKGAAIGSGIGMICSGIAKAEAKAKITGKAKVGLEAIKENISGASDCVEHAATPVNVSCINSEERYP